MCKGQVAVFYILLFIVALFSQQVLAQHEVKQHKDIEWAKVKGFSLTTDICSPEKAVKPLPVLVIFHGGGWLLNSKAIMNDMALYMASNANQVVVNMNYRLLADNNNSTTANEIVEDALGALGKRSYQCLWRRSDQNCGDGLAAALVAIWPLW